MGTPDSQPRRRPGRLSVAGATALALAVGALATPASADLAVNGTLVTPTRLDAATHYVLYYLQMHSAATPERFSVTMTAPPFATVGTVGEGQSIDGPTDIALQGPGALGTLVQAPSVMAACSGREAAFHGYATGPATVDVYLPANSATTLAVRYATGRRAPWVDSDFRLRFTVQGQLVGTYGAGSPLAGPPTVMRPVSMTTTGPIVSGRTGAHIVLSTSPPGTPGAPFAPRPVGRSQGIAISGRLLPAAAGRNIVLQWAHSGGALHTLTTVRTDAQGRFTASSRWRPAAVGTYELWAAYPQQPGGLVPDSTSCPLRFKVR